MIERIEIDGEVIWVIEEAIAEEIIGLMVLRGKARDMNIGLGRDSQREVARVLSGYIVYLYLGIGVEKAVCTISLRLHGRGTKCANDSGENGCDQDFECTVFDIVKAWLQRRGYEDGGA